MSSTCIPESTLPDVTGQASLTETSQLSKNQLKRRIREEHYQATKAQKKERQKRQKQEARQKKGTLESKGENANDEIKYLRSVRNKDEMAKYLQRCEQSFAVVIDCAWEDLHSDTNLTSLTQQVMFCYGANRRHDNPCKLFLTGVGPRVDSNLTKCNFRNWCGVRIENIDYVDVPGFTIDTVSSNQETTQKQLVYLTSDAEETLTELDHNCAYVIGGIVDRNKHKGVTYNKALSQNVRTAKLPIKEYFKLAATHILTVNHVFEILLNFSKYGDWTEAIKAVIPTRKEAVVKTSTVGMSGGTDNPNLAEEKDTDTEPPPQQQIS